MSRRALAVVLVVLAAAGCARNERDSTPATGDTATASRPAPPSGATTAAGVATRFAGWRWERTADGERFTLLFSLPDGTPARPSGPINTRVLRDLGVVRMTLPADITTTAVTDSSFGGGMVARAFVVRALADRTLFVDVHPRTPIEASMATGGKLGEWAVLVRRGGGPWPVPATSERRVVVLTPRRGASIDSVFVVSGYARTFESNVVARLEEGGAVRDTFTTAAEWAETWGEYRMSLPAPHGRAILFVGEYSAQDGSPQGVRIPIGRR